MVPNNSKIFGEKVIVTNRKKLNSKLEPRGKQCIWVGYADLHSKDTHRIYNPKTRSLILSRDVTFLRKDPKLSEVTETIEAPNAEPTKIQAQVPTTVPTTLPAKTPSKMWIREDKGMKRFLTTLTCGPSWKHVTGRVTYDLDSKKEIENVIINSKTQEKYLHRQLPKGVKNIRTILYHDDPNVPTMDKVEAVDLLAGIDADQDLEDPAPPPLMTPIVSDDEDSSDEEEEPKAVDEDTSNENNTGKEKQVSFAGPDAKVMRAMKN